MSKFRRRTLAAAVGVIATALVLTGSPAVFADDQTIDPQAVGSLSIHKHITPESGSAVGDGTELTPGPDADPLAGVEFRVRQVEGIDLATNAGQRSASQLASTFAGNPSAITAGGYTLGADRTPAQPTTDAAGLQYFGDLPVGVYLVEEVGTPSQVNGEDVVVTPAAPFIVTVPITVDDGAGGTSWLYDVHVYPKNSITSASKTVVDGDVAKIGDVLTWGITGTIGGSPVDLDGDGSISGPYEEFNIARYTIVDPLDSRLEYVTTPAYSVQIVDPAGVVAAETLTEGDDFTFTAPAAGNDNTLMVDFTPDGLQKMMVRHGHHVVLTFSTRITGLGSVENVAQIWPDGFDIDWQPGEPGGPVTTNPSETKFGGVMVLKTNDAQPAAALPGAKFEVYTEVDGDGRPVAASKVVIDDGAAGVSQWETAADGTLTIDGLRHSDWAGNAQVVDTDGDDEISDEEGFVQYYLVEVVAPSVNGVDYSLLPMPVPFTVTGEASTDPAQPDLTVVNVPKNAGFSLPLTGGAGMTLIIVLGALLVAGGAASFLVTQARRRSKNTEQVASALL
ncbi:SpaH/EbpB family LPXTG-anchored major pilin [Leucobacter triazinivorans]|uniref:SpaH/EbpB family LPXTG-anchored major pilin n=1 Tax=Leucobacter triazinivorans TaxID=1784719 RepID=UPI0013EE7F43|nr:SpaH/EbpB family LPXTG-anchored major pilin [Leucobacter triazinivorans]